MFSSDSKSDPVIDLSIGVAEAFLLANDVAVATVDDVGVIRFLSSGAAELLGYTDAEILGASIFDFLHVDDASEAAKLFVRRLQYRGPDLGHDIRVRDATGLWIKMNVTATVLSDSRLGTAALRLRVCNEQAEMETELRRKLVVEEFCNRLSGSFMDASSWTETIGALENSLSELALLSGAEAAAIFLERGERGHLERMARWVDPLLEAEFGLSKINFAMDPDTIELALREMIRTNDVQRTHGSTGALARSMVIRGLISSPFETTTQRGVVVLSRYTDGPEWSDGDAELTKKAAGLYGRALRLARSEQLLTLTYQEGPIGFSIRTVDGVLVDCNQRYLELAGQPREDFNSLQLRERLHPDDRDWVLEQHRRVGQGETAQMNLEARMRTPDGEWRYVHVNAVRLDTPGSIEPFVLTSLEDVTAKHEQQLALEYAATHDSLTGVANRKTLTDRIEAFGEEHGRLPNLLILDVDRFKLVNDSLGHLAGDKILCEVARRLILQVRDGDMIARVGGDEFAIIVSNLDPKHARQLAERLRRSMEEPLTVAGHATPQTLSIGVALGQDCTSVTELMARGDRAMYSAKAQGRNRHVVFDHSMRDAELADVSLERELRHAIDHDELVMHFQPEFALGDHKIVGAEALIRWQHPTRGLLAAGQFIEVAERSGMIDDIGRFALREACRSFGEIMLAADDLSLTLRVNISGREWGRPELPDLVRSAIANAGIDPAGLCLEVTEMTLMESPEIALDTFTRLQEIGVEFAIDDFGTGYSSLAYLKRFPIDSLKIDRSFVEDVDWSTDSHAIVESIIGLTVALGLDVVAEGVETQAQAEILSDLGCDRAQGFLLAGALPPEAFLRALGH